MGWHIMPQAHGRALGWVMAHVAYCAYRAYCAYCVYLVDWAG